MEAFQIKQLNKGSVFNKLFKTEPKENVLVEVNNLLASKAIIEITKNDLNDILDKYKISWNAPLLITGFYDFYKTFINYLSKLKKMSKENTEYLNHLKNILNLDNQKADDEFYEIFGSVYQDEVRKVLSKQTIIPNDLSHLTEFYNSINLPIHKAEEIYKKEASKIISDMYIDVFNEGSLSPDKEDLISKKCIELQVNLSIDDETKKQIKKYKKYWEINNLELKPIEVDINLQKSEDCYFSSYIEWLEQRTITKRINYSGPVARVKIMKGLYWRAASIKPQVISEDIWQKIDYGTMYLTNKRIIFMGSKCNKTIPLNKILDIEAYSNGVEIQKDTGKNPFISITNDNDIFSMILNRCIDEQSK